MAAFLINNGLGIVGAYVDFASIVKKCRKTVGK